MTIDDALAEYNAWKITISENVSTDCDKALDMMVDIVKKYQQIEQIVEHWSVSGNPVDSMIAISEVIVDGKA